MADNDDLKTCPAHPGHEPFNAQYRCPWCEITKLRAQLADESESYRQSVEAIRQLNIQANRAPVTPDTRQRDTITISRPHVPYGPKGVNVDEADADYLRKAATDLAEFYRPFGSNLCATIVKLIRDAADAIAAQAPAASEPECGCGGRRWVEDQNYQPEDYERNLPRAPERGLIPCGGCNHGGWDTDEWAGNPELDARRAKLRQAPAASEQPEPFVVTASRTTSERSSGQRQEPAPQPPPEHLLPALEGPASQRPPAPSSGQRERAGGDPRRAQGLPQSRGDLGGRLRDGEGLGGLVDLDGDSLEIQDVDLNEVAVDDAGALLPRLSGGAAGGEHAVGFGDHLGEDLGAVHVDESTPLTVDVSTGSRGNLDPDRPAANEQPSAGPRCDTKTGDAGCVLGKCSGPPEPCGGCCGCLGGCLEEGPGASEQPLFSSDAEEEERLQIQTLRAAQTLADGGKVGHVPTVVGNLLAMYQSLPRPAASEQPTLQEGDENEPPFSPGDVIRDHENREWTVTQVGPSGAGWKVYVETDGPFGFYVWAKDCVLVRPAVSDAPSEPGPDLPRDSDAASPLGTDTSGQPAQDVQIETRQWVMRGETILDDPDQYRLDTFVRHDDLPEIITAYLAANRPAASEDTPESDHA